MQSEDSTYPASKIRELEERITQKLKPDLEKAIEQRRVLQAQLQDYVDLEQNLQLLAQQVSKVSVHFLNLLI
jgi:DNA repair ATPase RecN